MHLPALLPAVLGAQHAVFLAGAACGASSPVLPRPVRPATIAVATRMDAATNVDPAMDAAMDEASSPAEAASSA